MRLARGLGQAETPGASEHILQRRLQADPVSYLHIERLHAGAGAQHGPDQEHRPAMPE